MLHPRFPYGLKLSAPRRVFQPANVTQTYLVMPNVVRTLQSLNCKKNVYWGTSAGSSGHFRQYFRGLGYGLSWPLVSWIGSANLPYAHKIKIEDARTGQWLRLLDPVLDPVQRIDYGWAMGDWNQLNYTTETVALRKCLTPMAVSLTHRLAEARRLDSGTEGQDQGSLDGIRPRLYARVWLGRPGDHRLRQNHAAQCQVAEVQQDVGDEPEGSRRGLEGGEGASAGGADGSAGGAK